MPSRNVFSDVYNAVFNRARANPKEALGVGGTAVFGGYIVTNEKNPKLTGRERYVTYSDIVANTTIVAAGIRYYLNLVSKASWRVEPAEDGGAQAEEYASLVEEMMYDMTTPWHRVVRRAAMYRLYGFSVQEWTAKKREDGFVGMLDVESRPQSTIEKWDLDRTGTVLGVVQVSPQDGAEIYLPRSKIIHVVDDTLNDSPEGLGVFRHIVAAAQRLSRYEELEGHGFETDLRGVPVGRAPFSLMDKMLREGKITAEQKVLLEKPVKDFLTNHIKNPALGIMLDSAPYTSQDASASPSALYQWGLDLLQGASPSLAEIAGAIERVNREIARVLGVEHLLLGSGEGSHALSRDKTHNFALIVDSSLNELSETYRSDYVGPVGRMNGWDRFLLPSYKTEQIQFRDVEQITGALAQLAQAGAPMAPDDEGINEVRELLGLSRIDLDRVAEDAALKDRMLADALTAGAAQNSAEGKEKAGTIPVEEAGAIPAKGSNDSTT